MIPSNNCADLIKSFESCKLTSYPDPGTGSSPWTIGWGSTGKDIGPGMVWTQAQADERFRNDLDKFGKSVSFWTYVELNQNQFDALCSFAYNAKGWTSSTLIRKVNAKDFSGAAQEFGKWIHGGNGQVLPGLIRRRAAERSLFEKRDKDNTSDTSDTSDTIG